MTDVIRLQKSVFVPQLKEIGFLRRELCYASTVGLLAVVIRLSMPKNIFFAHAIFFQISAIISVAAGCLKMYIMLCKILLHFYMC